MADQKISQLNSLTGANTASGDLVTIVDISDTTMGASGTNKKMTLTEFQASPVSAGTANGVTYLNASKVLTSGSALTFDGTNLGIGTASPGVRLDVAGATRIRAGNAIFFQNAAADNNATISCTGGSGNNTMSFNSGAMTLDGSGNLGIGTASPVAKLHVSTSGVGYELSPNSVAAGNGTLIESYSRTGSIYVPIRAIAEYHRWDAAAGERMRLDASGNLGIGTSTFGTSAAGVLSLGTGTAPTTGPADTVQLFSVDRSAGNTIPAVRCEGSGVTNAGITNTTVTTKIAMQVNGTIYYLLATTNAT